MRKMPQTRLTARRAARVIAWSLVGAAVMLTVGPRAIRPYTGISHDVEHMFAFGAVGLAFGFAYPRRLIMMLVIAAVLVGVLEAGQLVVPGRHAYFRDFILNGLAVFTGLMMGTLADKLRSLNSARVGRQH